MGCTTAQLQYLKQTNCADSLVRIVGSDGSVLAVSKDGKLAVSDVPASDLLAEMYLLLKDWYEKEQLA